MLINNAKRLYDMVKSLEKDIKKNKYKLPSECYFLNENEIVCYPREIGDGRYPYQCNGLTMWAYSSGNISVGESLFNVFLTTTEGKEPNVAFFVGEKLDNGGYFPISITGVARQPFEKNIKRFTIYTPEAVYYFTETDSLLSYVIAFIDSKKRICFVQSVENISNHYKDIYLSCYLNPLLKYQDVDDFCDKWFKQSVKKDYGYLFSVSQSLSRSECQINYGALRIEGEEGFISSTTSRFDFTGATANSLNCSTSLQNGTFKKAKKITEFSDIGIAGEINAFTLKVKSSKQIYYVMSISTDLEKVELSIENDKSLKEIIENEFEKLVKKNENNEMKNLKVSFNNFTDYFVGKDEAFNYFLANVILQTDVCSHSKNYAGTMLGIRDIMQQLEATIAWDAKYVKSRIIEILNFIGDNGCAPRQIAYPPSNQIPPQMDLRAFIDQGVWIISTVYSYLCYSNDYSILDEICGYYNFDGLNNATGAYQTVKFSNRKDSVLDHLLAIVDYLLSNIDENTGCLHALYGDWNDALDGLGETKKEGKVFGTGVSVMASCQLYQNLNEIIDILKHVNKYAEKINHYELQRNNLRDSLIKNAIVSKDNEHKILHGWGDDRSYLIGSYKDNDGLSRDSLTANAFWILSKMNKEQDLTKDILNAFKRLEDKYGLKTFEPYFATDNDKVGRIIRLPKGTAENGATYNHSTAFAIWSLLEINQDKWAWDELYKLLPIEHEFLTTTPFVMSNSYVHNEEIGLDGESMNDWFTGTGCVLIKLLIGSILGIKPTLDGLTVEPSKYIPCENVELSLKIKNANINLIYVNKNSSIRKFFINDKEVSKISLPNHQISGSINIKIVD